MEYNKVQFRTWSILGKRGTFGSVLTEFAPYYDNLLAMSADFTRSSGLERFSKLYPDKYLNVGIAEQNLIGVASGLASEGYNVFATSFAAFVTTRCFEMIKVHCGYMRHNIKVVGLAAGFGVQQQGNTHYGLDDICLMRTIPNMTIVSPSDSTEVVKATEQLLNFEGPAYLRLCGESVDPIVYKSDYDFIIGKAVILRDGCDVAFIATGSMVYQSLAAAKNLEGLGVECAVINMHTINPIDKEVIERYSRSCKLIVTVEEGFVSGGLAAAVLEVIANLKGNTSDVLNIGLSGFPHAGSYKYMLSETGLDSEHIAARVSDKLANL